MKKIILTSLFSLALFATSFATDSRASARLAKMDSKVHFTADQSAKTQVILESYFSREDELKAKLKGKDLEQALSKVRIDSKERIISLLTPDQRKIFLAQKAN